MRLTPSPTKWERAGVRVHDLEPTLTFVLSLQWRARKENCKNTNCTRLSVTQFFVRNQIAQQNPCIPSSILHGN
jgi:hypothetical protein